MREVLLEVVFDPPFGGELERAKFGREWGMVV